MERPKRAFWEHRANLPPGPLYGAPLVPSESDIRYMEARAESVSVEIGGRPMRALMLGVTQPIAQMRWPDTVSLLAVDWSMGMIRRVWAGREGATPRAAVLADWRELPLPAGSIDLAVGDGCYAALSSFVECAEVNAEVRRVLRPGGWFVQRCFVRPEVPESLDELFRQLWDGRIRSFEAFCWRIAMSVHDDAGARVGDAWDEWNRRVGDRSALLARRGWSESTIAMIERWRGVDARMPVPTLAELHALVEPRFEIAEYGFADYEMGDRCARIALRARP